MLEIKVKYHYEDLERLQQISIGNWIDMRSAETIHLEKGEDKLISLGVSMKLPDGYEAHIVPRSSTLKNFGVIQANHMGVVDSTYAGEDDIWKFWAIAMRSTWIHFNDRICQFRIMQVQPQIQFVEVDRMEDASRGGFGSTGKSEYISAAIEP